MDSRFCPFNGHGRCPAGFPESESLLSAGNTHRQGTRVNFAQPFALFRLQTEPLFCRQNKIATLRFCTQDLKARH